ncbi:MAG TPA: DNA translocase FtsK [Clostridiales bacterium]|nr:DNA translocase FtsK [Clostridiales bacterium]
MQEKKINEKVNVLKKEILGVIIIAFASFLIFVVNQTGQIGIVGDWIKIFLVAIFGKGMYVLPFVIMLMGVLQLLNILIYSEKKQIIAISGLFLCILMIIAIRDCTVQNFFPLDKSIVEVFKISIDYNQLVILGGGLLGNITSYRFIKLLGITGTYILISAFILVFTIIFTNQSLISFFKIIINFIKKTVNTIYNFIYIEVENDEDLAEENKKKIKKEKHKPSVEESDAQNQNIQIFDYNSDHPEVRTLQNKSITQLKIEDIKVTKDIEEEKQPVKKEFEIKPKEEVEISNTKENKLDDIKIVDNSHDFKSNPVVEYKLPDISLLNNPKQKTMNVKEDLKREAEKLIETLQSFNIQCNITQISKGPSITRYELQPAPGIKVSRITSLQNDIALNLATSDIRIEAPIPGKSAVGIEVPNKEKTDVLFKSLVDSREFKELKSKIPFALGKDIAGKNIVGSIEKMPHLLVAGATGSGKSVCINSLIMSILYKARPDEVKLILIDPKVVELNIYNGIPHLLIPVVTDPRKASNALNWAVSEMTTRYKIFAQNSVRDIFSFNDKMLKENRLEEKMPQIVIIIDELADLMQVAPGEVEECITRIAQLARACGIHLVIATQRPSVDVITGTIKANIPSRIAFAVSSYIDSRTILDASGAEKLLGKGDMLYHPMGMPKPIRIQGTFISDDEIKRVVEQIVEQKIQQKVNNINAEIEKAPAANEKVDDLLEQVIELVVEEGQASASYLQRRFSIGYNRAARLIDALEERGIISGYEGSKPRKVLITKEELEEMKE